MRKMTITVDNVPENIYAAIWEASIKTGPKTIHDMQPTEHIQIDYRELPSVAKNQVAEMLVVAAATVAFAEILKRGGK